jgi:uncharacterized protein (TIGR03382 family)
MTSSTARIIKISFISVFAGLGVFASAQVTSYDAFRSQFMTQSSDSAPTSVDAYQFATRIFLTSPDDADSGTLTDPNNNAYSMTPQPGNFLFYGDASSANQSSEDSTYPTGMYTYTLNGGTNGYDGNSATLQVMPTDFATTVPYLTGNTYSLLQGFDPSQSLALNWGDFADALGTSDRETFFSITNVATGVTVYSNSNGADVYTGDEISAGELEANTTYQYSIFFSSRFSENNGITYPNNAFFGAGSLSSFDIGTSGTFTTAPEPITLAVFGVGLLALRRRRR